eukprot:Blabericola_migrator_1__5062@NODE_2621_length_2527_cov_96_704065_g1494_i1_p1_GENE_NODE_2621_length_2527_cov_96_704065_g1494_i1NODE_2621_length_2527_cov_96_704065_g1494_i1_p1_ORF_typecomplete_len330_score36_30_NODE_2621_length_2527_cov_96_704065_g1494_i12691258
MTAQENVKFLAQVYMAALTNFIGSLVSQVFSSNHERVRAKHETPERSEYRRRLELLSYSVSFEEDHQSEERPPTYPYKRFLKHRQPRRHVGQLYLGDVCPIVSVGNKAGAEVVRNGDTLCCILSYLPFQLAMTCRRLNRDADINITNKFAVDYLPLDEIWYPGYDKFISHGGMALNAVLNRSLPKVKVIKASSNFAVPLGLFAHILLMTAPTLREIEVVVVVTRIPMLPIDYITCLSEPYEGQDGTHQIVMFPVLRKIRWLVLEETRRKRRVLGKTLISREERYLPFPFIKKYQCPAIESLELHDKAFASLCNWDSEWDDTPELMSEQL